jgi:hypothetical protein
MNLPKLTAMERSLSVMEYVTTFYNKPTIKTNQGWECSSGLDRLLGVGEALHLIPSTAPPPKKMTKKGKQMWP